MLLSCATTTLWQKAMHPVESGCDFRDVGLKSGPKCLGNMEHRLGTAVRHIVLHYHLSKNGGDIIDRILDKHFGDALAHLNGNSPNSVLHNSELLSFLRQHPNVDAVSSFHLRPPKPDAESFVFFDVIFIRHPLDRIYAILETYRSGAGPADSLQEVVNNGDLREFLQRLVTEYPHLINDAQVNYLAHGGRYFRPPDESDLHRAAQIMQEAALPGSTNLFSISLATAEYYLGPAFGNLDLSYVNPRPCSFAESWRERVDKLRDLCGSLIYEQLLRMNTLDLQLIDITEAEIYRRYHVIPEREKRVEEFIERCQKAAEFYLEHDEIETQ